MVFQLTYKSKSTPLVKWYSLSIQLSVCIKMKLKNWWVHMDFLVYTHKYNWHFKTIDYNRILRGYHMGGSVIWFLSNEWWCDITNERGTSEWAISHQHDFDKIISHCHPCDYLLIIYHNTRNNRSCVYTVQITFIFIGQTHLVFGKRVCTCVTKHSNAFRTFLN